MKKLIIIGSGPAGYTAAIYAARALLDPLVFEGSQVGGQLTTTTDVENFPGFLRIMGPDLMLKLQEQAVQAGAMVHAQDVDSVDFSEAPKVLRVSVDGQVYETRAIIIATGASARRLHVPGEELYWQKGISACAVCDGGLPLFRNQPLLVVGGGDTAAEEATYLAKFASHVTMLVRGARMRASKVMQARVEANPKISILYHTELQAVLGNKQVVTGADLIENGKTRHMPVRGIFYAIGHDPNTGFLGDQVAMQNRYIITDPHTMATSVPGVYACGDVQDAGYRQAVYAAGTGCQAAMAVEHYLA